MEFCSSALRASSRRSVSFPYSLVIDLARLSLMALSFACIASIISSGTSPLLCTPSATAAFEASSFPRYSEIIFSALLSPVSRSARSM